MSTTGAAASPPTPSAEAEGEHEHHDAFISYSHVDAEFAESVRSALEARDTDVWIDESDIPSGSRWREELERAIETSDAFVFLPQPRVRRVRALPPGARARGRAEQAHPARARPRDP